jgi:hypothetical protein
MRRSVTKVLQQHLLRKHCPAAPEALQQQAVQVSSMNSWQSFWRVCEVEWLHAMLNLLLHRDNRYSILLPASRPPAQAPAMLQLHAVRKR